MPRAPRRNDKETLLAALTKLAPDRVVDALASGLQSPHLGVRVWAAQEGDQAAVPFLAKRVADEATRAGQGQAGALGSDEVEELRRQSLGAEDVDCKERLELRGE